MRSMFLLVLLIGVGIAGFAVYKANDYFEASDQTSVQLVDRIHQLNAEIENLNAQIVETAEVYVFKESMRYGERFTIDDVTTVTFPIAAIPAQSFVFVEPSDEEDAEAEEPIQELFPEGAARYRALVRSVEAGEIVMPIKVTEPGEDAGIMYRLLPGNSAFAINVSATSGVSGFIRPGDNVNIFWTGSVQGQNITKLIASGVNVIAIDQSSDEDILGARLARTITVQGTPQEIAQLQQAQSAGSLTLSLVRSGEVADDIEVTTNLLDSLNIEVVAPEPEPEPEPLPEPEPEPEQCFQTIRRGVERVQIEVPCPT